VGTGAKVDKNDSQHHLLICYCLQTETKQFRSFGRLLGQESLFRGAHFRIGELETGKLNGFIILMRTLSREYKFLKVSISEE